MNILVTILLVIVGIIALLLILGLFVRKGYFIERSVLINKSRQEVFDYVKIMKNQDLFSKWVMKDPNMKKDFRGTDGTEGFVYAWNSVNNQAGEGEMEIKKITGQERIDMEIRFVRPMKGVSDAAFVLESNGNQTNTKWSFKSEMKYPLNVMMLFMNFENMLGKDMDESLAMLKNNLEK
ncbi:MAG TPA: SRPBCC family protein [Cyclobacteriaceae bacterium]|nr:SRPBCC family protein [Cyclobacteriaceae bacterium]